MNKPWYSVSAKQGNSAELTIDDEIGAHGLSAKTFVAALAAVKSPKIDLRINSPGGDVIQGIAVYEALRASGKTINVTIMGVAAGVACYVALACSKITMPENTFMYLMNDGVGLYGDADDMRNAAEAFDRLALPMIAVYAARMKRSEAEVKRLMHAGTLLTASECLAMGLCDEVRDALAVRARFETSGMPKNVRAMFSGTTASVWAARNRRL